MKTITIIFLLFGYVYTYNILAILSHPGRSHFCVFEPLLKALAAKKHNVTVISYFPRSDEIPNYTDVLLGDGKESGIDKESLEGAFQDRMIRYLVPYISYLRVRERCTNFYTSRGVGNILSQRATSYDVIIVEEFTLECTLGFVYKLQAPFIKVTSAVPLPWHHQAMNFPNNPSYIPNSFLFYSSAMRFLERVENSGISFLHQILYRWFVTREDNIIVCEYLGNDIPLVEDIARNTSLMLVNSHFALISPRPMVPGYIEIAGAHIKSKGPLPKHIEKWINESTHGVIYFSMGSMIKGHTFPEEKRQMFLRAFARLPQRVLWKWETETMPGKPDNVLLLKWMPQFDILCHPNVKVFIAHGGLLGVTESVHCGVPMLLMPQFGDQFTNAKAIEANGGGLMLDFRYITEEQIFETLTSLLSDNFNKKAKELSARFKDRPMPPLETAIYWVEYVARHGGAPHLRTAAVGMPLYQYLLLDVIAFLLTIFIVFTYVWYKILKFIYRKIFSAKQKVKTN